MANEWCDQLKLQLSDLKPGFVVCSNHFSDKMFVETDGSPCRTRLKKIAYPNINLPVAPGIKRLAIVKRIGRDDETTIKILDSMKEYPCLWNPSIEEYRDEERRAASIQLVADETKCEEELLMDRIDEIRTNFIQQLATLEENPDDSIQISWFQKAQFLWDGITGEEISESFSLPPLEKKQRLADTVEIKRPQPYPKRCRICLDVQKSNRKTFVELTSGDGLVKMFKKLTKFRVLFDQGDHLPRHICETCQSSMLASQKFMDRCNRTETILQTVYQCVDSQSAHQLLTDLKRSSVEIKMEVDEEQSEEEETGEEQPHDGKWETWEDETKRFEEINKWLDESKTKASRRSQREKKLTPKAKQTGAKARQSTAKAKQPALKIKQEPKAKAQRVVAQPKIKGQSPVKAEVTIRLCPFCGMLPRKNKSNEEHIKKCALNPDRVQEYFECEHCPLRYTSKGGKENGVTE
jgi:Alcohol dehydrogenase transcription factor Myb/SANT-like/Zinc-finger associated domain (zf-AD)